MNDIKYLCQNCKKEVKILKPFLEDKYKKLYCLDCYEAKRKDKVECST
jgi:hypothetical protein